MIFIALSYDVDFTFLFNFIFTLLFNFEFIVLFKFNPTLLSNVNKLEFILLFNFANALSMDFINRKKGITIRPYIKANMLIRSKTTKENNSAETDKVIKTNVASAIKKEVV